MFGAWHFATIDKRWGINVVSTRARVLTFIGVLSAFTAFVQWDGAANLVDGITGGLRWSGELVKFFKANTQGLIQLILLGLFFEFVGLTKSKDKERREAQVSQALLERALASSTSSALVHGGLAEQYGLDAANEILRSSLKPCTVLRNLTLKISVSHSASGYVVNVSIAYDKDSHDFIVGVTENPLQCEALLATGVLSEVFVVPQVTNDIPAKVRKRIRDNRTGSDVYHPLTFRELPDRAKRRLFSNTTLQASAGKFRIFEGSSAASKSDNGPVMFEVLHEIEQSADYPFTFWTSDRVLQVKSMEIDLRSLTPAEQKGARIHLFMSSLQWSEDINPDKAVWHFPVQTWLLPGQGLVVMWPVKPLAS